MSRYIKETLRQLIAKRADYLCEYCLLEEKYTFLGCQVDHIISLKHKGETKEENLAYACVSCNRNKGSDIASVTSKGKLVRLFNPRIDKWSDHFYLQGARIKSLTEIGEVTIHVLQFNTEERLTERLALIVRGLYLSIVAKKQID